MAAPAAGAVVLDRFPFSDLCNAKARSAGYTLPSKEYANEL